MPPTLKSVPKEPEETLGEVIEDLENLIQRIPKHKWYVLTDETQELLKRVTRQTYMIYARLEHNTKESKNAQ